MVEPDGEARVVSDRPDAEEHARHERLPVEGVVADRQLLPRRAEQDLLVALSTCPGGDLSKPMFGPGVTDPVEICHPLAVSVHALDDELLQSWSEPASPQYRGAHGLTSRPWGAS